MNHLQTNEAKVIDLDVSVIRERATDYGGLTRDLVAEGLERLDNANLKIKTADTTIASLKEKELSANDKQAREEFRRRIDYWKGCRVAAETARASAARAMDSLSLDSAGQDSNEEVSHRQIAEVLGVIGVRAT